MTRSEQRPRFYRLLGIAALFLFAVFAGNIVLAKIAMMAGFPAPRLSPQWEFIILLVTTFLGIMFLLNKERQEADNDAHNTKFQPEEEEHGRIDKNG